MLREDNTSGVNGGVNAKQFDVGYEETAHTRTIAVRGELELSAAGYFRSAIEPVLGQYDKTLVFDLRELTYIDSTGIGIFIFALKARSDHPGSLRIENVPDRIQRLFDLTGMSRFLDAADKGGSRT